MKLPTPFFVVSVATAVAAAALVASSASAQQAVQWRVEDGGNGHWYAIDVALRTWTSARDHAHDVGGYLGTITSSPEQEFMRQNVYVLSEFGDTWLGAWRTSRTSCQAPFAWVSGEPFTGSPSGTDFSTDCWGWAGPSTGNYVEHVIRFGTVYGWEDESNDANIGNVSLIEWSADCNGDGIVDYGQCRDGSLPDYNGNNIPDCCERGEVCVVGNYPVQWRVEDGGNGHWYALSSGAVPVSRTAFIAAAATVGAQPVMLSSQAEELFVHARFGNVVLGLSAIPGASAFTWMADPNNSYSNWGTSACPWGPYPNNPTTAERFAELQSANCSGTQGISTKWDDYQLGEWPASVRILLEWSADCNGDGVVDYGQIQSGALADANGDGVPDVCQPPECSAADLMPNASVDGADLGALLLQWGPAAPGAAADLNADGAVDTNDLTILLALWGPCG